MNRIGKKDLINMVAEGTGLAKKDVEIILNTFLDTVVEEVSKGTKVQLVGFGFFEAKQRAARKGRNPQTGKEITINSKIVPVFKPGKYFRNSAARYLKQPANKKDVI